jgi:type III secretory pathway component EscU
MLRRKMTQRVPHGTAIIVHPTHYAVAIQHELDSPAGPVVTAKGKNYRLPTASGKLHNAKQQLTEIYSKALQFSCRYDILIW